MAKKVFERIVVKIGTNALMGNGRISKATITELARQLSILRKSGTEVMLVTSGAIGFGIEKLGVGFPKDNPMRQAMAAIGQNALMQYYEDSFSSRGQLIGQVLLTHQNFTSPESLGTLKKTMEKLLEIGAIPVINENDAVSVEALSQEKAFADNDGLAALVAVNFKADLLVILTDVDGIFTENPKENNNAQKIKDLKQLLAGKVVIGKKSDYGIGGMNSKLMAVQKALEHKISVAVCKARDNAVIDVISNNCSGSFFGGD